MRSMAGIIPVALAASALAGPKSSQTDRRQGQRQAGMKSFPIVLERSCLSDP